MGTPCITTDSGIFAEVLAREGTGLLLHPTNAKSWAPKLAAVLDGTLAVEPSSLAHVTQMMRWDHVARHTLLIYRNIFAPGLGEQAPQSAAL